MDIHALMNNEPTAARLQSQPPSQPSPARSSYTPHSEPSRYDASPPAYQPNLRERPPQPPPLYTNDPRSPGGSSTYASAQSPYQHASASTSTLSGGPNSYPFPSPKQGLPNQQHVAQTVQVAHPNSYNHASFVPSPSPHAPQPMTPGPPLSYSNQQRPQSSHSATSSSPTYMHAYPPRESPGPSAGGQIQNQGGKQYSLYSQQVLQPATPLGPPASYQRPSPKLQRHPSEYEHVRTLSTGSHGSVGPGELAQRQPSLGQPMTPREPVSRQYPYERERERSQSVSPKTVIQPGHHRQFLTESPKVDRSSLSGRSYDRAPSEQRSEVNQTPRLTDPLQTPVPMAAPAASHQRGLSSSQASSAYQSPVAVPNKIQTPGTQNASLPSHPIAQTTGLKRDASAISGSSASPQPHTRKRLRYEEIPIFARSARAEKQRGPKSGVPGRPAERGSVGPTALKQESEPRIKQEANGHMNDPGLTRQESLSVPPSSIPWEPSIANIEPYEDLTRFMCDRIFQLIGMAEPPIGGAKFEIEAKLGEIQRQEDQTRLDLAVLTETIIARDNVRLGPTRFESSMTVAHHKHLNEYLNECLVKTQEQDRQMMHYKHTQETDNFYDLSPEGRQFLPDHIRKYLNPRFKPRVRITTDIATGMTVAKIIKSRIADFDISNPRSAFDYRISVSIECPWDGPESHLIMVSEAEGRRGERRKDRMSYRHLAYQIDLTQVSYPQTQRQEHELEIEVSPDALRAEIQSLRDRHNSRYETLVRGFIDNVRLLARQFPAYSA